MPKRARPASRTRSPNNTCIPFASIPIRRGENCSWIESILSRKSDAVRRPAQRWRKNQRSRWSRAPTTIAWRARRRLFRVERPEAGSTYAYFSRSDIERVGMDDPGRGRGEWG